MVTTGETFTVVGQSDDGQWLQLAEGRYADRLGSSRIPDRRRTRRPRRRPARRRADSRRRHANSRQHRPAAVAFAPATMSSPDYGAQAFLWWRARDWQNAI